MTNEKSAACFTARRRGHSPPLQEKIFMTTPPSQDVDAVARSMASAKRILAATHTNPDGDAAGSLAAIGHIASALGVESRLYCSSPIPAYLNWLNFPSPVVTSLRDLGDWRPDRVVFLDCADASRAGKEMRAFIEACREKAPVCSDIEIVCIDHHVANPHYADINWVDPTMSATGVMTGLVAKRLGLPLAGDLGEAVYLAVVSDTGSFSFGNTNASALETAAEIVRNGLNLAEFTAKYENNWNLERMHLWGALMRDVKLFCGGKVVVSVITTERLEKYRSGHSDLEGYASWLRRLQNSKVVLVVRPRGDGSKASLRSMGDVDVQKIAALFGGGGHNAAAGIDMVLPPCEAATEILQAVCLELGEEPVCDFLEDA